MSDQPAEWTHMIIVPDDWEVKLASMAHVKEPIVMSRAAFDAAMRPPPTFYQSPLDYLIGEPLFDKQPILGPIMKDTTP